MTPRDKPPTTVPELYDAHKQFITQREEVLAQLLPPSLPARRLILVALTQMSRNPTLLKCTRSSIFQSLLVAAELGLEPSGTLGHFYLVPYKGEASGQVGFRGYVELGVRCGAVVSVEPIIIYDGEPFLYNPGEGTLSHQYSLDVPRGHDNIVAGYAKATLPNGSVVHHVMTIDEILERRKEAKTDNIWRRWFPEMCMKTVVKGLFLRGKVRIPPGSMLSQAVQVDTAADRGAGAEEIRRMMPQASKVVVQDEQPVAEKAEAAKPAAKTKTGKKPEGYGIGTPPPIDPEPPKDEEVVMDGDVTGTPKGGKRSPDDKMVAGSPSQKTGAPEGRREDALDLVIGRLGLTDQDLAAAATRFLGRPTMVGDLPGLTPVERLEIAGALERELAK